ncbi:TIGR03560 family F420-dependent LLM class oxidoreductase [Angustibacter peucedani]
MKLAIHCSNLSYPGWPGSIPGTLQAVARAADQGGVHTLTMMDHWFQMEPLGGPPEPMLEGYTSLGFLAGQTERVELGLLVTGVTYRHPGLLAKTVTTLHVLSGGRAMLGLGAAWYEREHQGLGVPYPSTSERFERLEETLQVVERMWSDDDSPFQGQHYQLAEPVNVPPIGERRPRVLIGGTGERKTLRLVARYADACNLFDEGHDVVRHKLDVLDRHCADVGRDPSEVSRTVIVRDDPFSDAFLHKAETYAGLGIDQIWLSPPPADAVAFTERVGSDVVARLADI